MDQQIVTENFQRTRSAIGYVNRADASDLIYAKIGFMCGLEVHQQLHTQKKLFCHCPAGIYQEPDDFDAEVIRHMRPTLSELGEYDGTALMEFRTRKNITYRVKSETACTYEIDDTPPFLMNRDALDIATELALLLKTNVVGELHITRKQYLDGSIPTGFQRTAIVGIEGSMQVGGRRIGIIQVSLEEDSCREVSDIGHERVYMTDRLGMPLSETVTYPDMKTPDEAAEVCQHIRWLARSTGHVNTGSGAGRQDVNVSVTGGTRVEIKGVSSTRLIPELTHNEAFRQWALLAIRDELRNRFPNPEKWTINHREIDTTHLQVLAGHTDTQIPVQVVAVNLPGFRNLLSHFTQPGRTFVHELSDRLKVIACLEKPNLMTSEDLDPMLGDHDWQEIARMLNADEQDAQLVIWGPPEDIPTALETVRERCELAFTGVPNETRRPLPDGRTLFERVLPGADRMYPDTDSAPIPIENDYIERIRLGLPPDVSDSLEQWRSWGIPAEDYPFLLRYALHDHLQQLVKEEKLDPKPASRLTVATLRRVQKSRQPDGIPFERWPQLIRDTVHFVLTRKLQTDILPEMLKVLVSNPRMELDSVLVTLKYEPVDHRTLKRDIPTLVEQFGTISRDPTPAKTHRWVMGQLRPAALGNVPLSELATEVRALVNKENHHA